MQPTAAAAKIPVPCIAKTAAMNAPLVLPFAKPKPKLVKLLVNCHDSLIGFQRVAIWIELSYLVLAYSDMMVALRG